MNTKMKIKAFDTFLTEAALAQEYFMVTGNDVIEYAISIRPDRSGTRWEELSYVDDRAYGGGRGKREVPRFSRKSSLSKEKMEKLGDSPFLVCKTTREHPNFIEGKIVAVDMAIPQETQIRFDISERKPTQIPEKLLRAVKENSGKSFFDTKKFFIGDEDLYDESGKKVQVQGGSYECMTMDLKMSIEREDLMLVCKDPRDSDNKPAFRVSAKTFSALPSEASEGEAKVLADWFANKIGGNCTYGDSRGWSSRGQKVFNVEYFQVHTAYRHNDPLGEHDYTASPFFSKELAEEHMKELKESGKKGKIFPFRTEDLKVESGGHYEFNYLQMTEYIKLLGMELNLRDFLKKKRGAVAGKDFGF